jgi:hypothetical protein
MGMFRIVALLAASACLQGVAAAAKPTRSRPAAPAAPPVLVGLTVTPPEVTLSGPRAERQILVTGRFSDGLERDLTAHARYLTLTPQVAKTHPGGIITPVTDGTGQVKAAVGKLSALVRVTTCGARKPTPISFHNEVIPILTKAGCNQGACHGSLYGKGGLKLSLLGSDPDADYQAVVKQNEGRRVVFTDPKQSLFLLKPAMGVPHAGGLRFKPGTYEYRTLQAWIEDGAPAPREDETAVTGVEVFPGHRVARLGPAPEITVAIPQPTGPPQRLKLSQSQRLVTVARFKDGSLEDVTRKAQLKSLNDAVAALDDSVVTLKDRGETAVMVRYRGMATVARFTAPYRNLTTFPAVARASFIDDLVAAKWKEMGLLPSPRCTDAEYIRRVYQDALGILPEPEAIRKFLASTEPQKRAKLVDEVLSRPEYVDYWTLKWGDLLRNHRDKLGEKGMWSFYNWLRAAFRDNKPMDQFTRELITAQGSTFTTGPANYFRVAGSPAEMAETTSQVFLGQRLQCARCHHHPYEKWTQDEYWQMAAFFSRVGLKGSDEFGLFGGEQVVRLSSTGEVSNPRTGKVMKPTPLDGEPVDDPIDRRRALAAWMTAPNNPYFARNIVNRYWGYLLGRGIVEPVDDLRVTNPASNPALLDALAKDFVAHKFDLKHLLRTIMTSETYQLSSNPTRDNKRDDVFYTKYAVKRMGAEELLDAISFATGTTEKFPSLPQGMRAVQLPDTAVQSYFLDTFGRPPRSIVCECERSVEPNMAQALHLMNSDFVQNKITAGNGRLAKLLEAKKSDKEIVEELYLVTFSRPSTEQEAVRAQLSVTQAANRKEGFEDLLWALINSREFIFKH